MGASLSLTVAGSHRILHAACCDVLGKFRTQLSIFSCGHCAALFWCGLRVKHHLYWRSAECCLGLHTPNVLCRPAWQGPVTVLSVRLCTSTFRQSSSAPPPARYVSLRRSTFACLRVLHHRRACSLFVQHVLHLPDGVCCLTAVVLLKLKLCKSLQHS